MKRKIFAVLLLLAAVVLLFCCGTISALYYTFYHDQAKDQLSAFTNLMKDSFTSAMSQEQFDTTAKALDFSEPTYPIRVTLIAPDGRVLFDNQADPAVMENHGGREEVIKALETGYGEIERFSDTARTSTLYCARLTGEGNVLRLSRSIDSIWALFSRSLFWVLWVLLAAGLIALLLSRYLSRAIIRPIHRLSDELDQLIAQSETPIYDELEPFARRLRELTKNNLAFAEQIQTEREMLEAITDHMQEGFLLLDSQDTLLIANASVRRMLGASAPLSASQPLNLLQFTRNHALLQVIEQARQEGRHLSRDMQLEEGDGRWYRVLVNLLFHNGERAGLIVLLLDITAETKAELMRREFAANVSHELKTPLTTIAGFAELMAGGMIQKREDIQKYAGTIDRESKRLIRLITDIIRLSQIEDAPRPDAEPVQLLSLARQVADDLHEAAQKQQVSVSVTGEDLVVPGNRGYLEELLRNLLDNAIKYNTLEGQVSVTVRAGEASAVLEVRDTGIGIPKESQYRVFERFYRVDKSRSREIGGTGLGLSIVKHIVEYHGGAIDLKSEENLGTTVTVTLPLA